MSQIVAVCPYCRQGGVRAPKTAIGDSVTCPKCKSNFTVVPTDGPLPEMEAEPPRGTDNRSDHGETTETRPITGWTEDGVTAESQPAWAAAPSPASCAAIAPTSSTTTPSDEEAPTAPDLATVLALVAAIGIGLAVIATQFPIGRWIGGGIAAVCLVLGLLTLGAEGRVRLWGGLAAAGHALLLLLIVFLPSWLNIEPIAASSGLPDVPVRYDHATAQRHILATEEWIPAGQASWEYRGLRVTVSQATVGPLELRGPKDGRSWTKESYLQLQLTVGHVGMEDRKRLTQWAAGQAEGIRLRDAAGRELSPARLTLPAGWTWDRGQPLEHLLPDQSSRVRLVLEPPGSKSGPLQLELSGAALGFAEQVLRFRVEPRPAGVGPPGTPPQGAHPTSPHGTAPLPRGNN